MPRTKVCASCGMPFVGQNNKYCSGTCYYDALAKSHKNLPRICNACGKEYTGYNIKYCSSQCAQTSLKGRVFTSETKKRMSDSAKNRDWPDRKMSNGYVLVRVVGHPFAYAGGYVPEHRLIMEKKLGRHLLPTECVHHIDGSRDNNSENNLELKTLSEHSKLHNKILWDVDTAIEAYIQGATIPTIAKLLNIAKGCVRSAFKIRGVL